MLFQAWKNATKVATYLLVVVLGRSIGFREKRIKDVVDDSINFETAEWEILIIVSDFI